jgi:hypothetical protein
MYTCVSVFCFEFLREEEEGCIAISRWRFTQYTYTYILFVVVVVVVVLQRAQI